MKSILSLAACLCLLVTYGQIKPPESRIVNAAGIALYGKVEWDIVLHAGFENPFEQRDIKVDMVFKTPSGKSLVLPCYYVSGKSGSASQWKARFLPQETGKYDYSISVKEKDRPGQSTALKSFIVKPSSKNGILHLKDDWTFVFDNGKTFRGIGENICWESRANDDSKFFKDLHEDTIFNYERMLPRLVANGGNYFRTWVCRWNLPVDWKSGFNNNRYTTSDEYYNPSAIKKMDRLIDLCDSLGLYMMLTLGPGAYMKSEGGFASSSADFFVNADAKAKYKDRLRYFVARWGYSASVGAWEFFNEVDNVQFRNAQDPIKAEHIVQWHDEMSAYLKSIDPYDHLVTTSISHRDLEGLNSLKHIDFNQRHMYKVTRQMPGTIKQFARSFGKPYVIGEFGYEWDWSKNFDDFADGMDSDYKRGLWYGLFAPTPVLPLSWWWEYFDNRGTDAYIKNVRTMLDRMLKVGKGSFDSVPVTSGTGDVEMYSVKCGNEIYIYMNNLSGRQQLPAATVSAAIKGRTGSWEIYDCETGKYINTRLTVSSKGTQSVISNIVLPPQKDIIVILK